MKWVKALSPDGLTLLYPNKKEGILIKYNNGGDRELGGPPLIKDLYECGWDDVEWLDEAQEEDKWISFKERLPEVNAGGNYSEELLLITEDGCKIIGYYDFRGRIWVNPLDDTTIFNVTHYQPLPPAPINKKEE